MPSARTLAALGLRISITQIIPAAMLQQDRHRGRFLSSPSLAVAKMGSARRVKRRASGNQ
jgi:hypothetical protein